MDTTNLIAYLPFDESTTLDLCGNEWTATGTVSIVDGAANFNISYLRSNEQVTFGGAEFTISFYTYLSSSSHYDGGLFCAQPTTQTGNSNNAGRISFFRPQSTNNLALQLVNAAGSTIVNGVTVASNFLNARHHFELDYSHSNSTLKIFVDGQLTYTKSVEIERLARYFYLGCTGYDPNSQRMVGSIDEFQVFDGVALHSDNFTPPTDADYALLKWTLGIPITLNCDVERIITNAAWKPSMNLKARLPFNRTPTEDLCGNEWTLNGDATIEETGAINGNALQVTHAYIDTQYGWLGLSTPRLYMNDGIILGGQSFTIKGCVNFALFPNRWNGGYGEIFVLSPTAGGTFNDLHSNPSTVFLSVSSNGYLSSDCLGIVDSITKLELNQTYAFEYVYSHSDGKVFIFLDGQKVNTVDVNIPETVFPYVYIDYSHWSANHPTAAIDEFKIYDGAALHTENFIPPTAENYIQQMLEQEGQAAFGYSLNTERVLTNNRKPINPYIAFSGANGCYGEVPLETLAGKSTFTIEAKFSTTTTASSSNSWQCGTIFGREIGGYWQDDFGLYINGGKLFFLGRAKTRRLARKK